MATILILATLDTKGEEAAYVRDRIRQAGLDTLIVDAGILDPPGFPADIPRTELAHAAGVELSALIEQHDRGTAVAAMAAGATIVVRELYADNRFDGAIGLGGTGGTAIASQAFRQLPIGVPRMVVSTAASGDTSKYIGESDLILVPSVVDIAGLNRISTRILAGAAAAIVGMAEAPPVTTDDHRPLIAASMFGVTTACITRARARLEQLGYEVLVFHMTGAGGRTLESLAKQGLLSGILDVTTTELADELVGGIFSAGPRRLLDSGAAGIPRIVSVGALDMVNFGPPDTVPNRFADRRFYPHNPSTTLMRTTPAENAELGARLAERINAGNAETTVYLPLEGVSAIDVPDGPFHDPDADEALFAAIRNNLADAAERLVEATTDVNDPVLADAMADHLHAMIQNQSVSADATR